MDPLVEEYLRKKQGLDQGVEDARSRSEMMTGLAGIGEVAINGLSGGPVVYEKGWNETGPPQTQQFQKPADLSALRATGQRGLQSAQETRNQGLADFDNQQKYEDLSTNRARSATKFDTDIRRA